MSTPEDQLERASDTPTTDAEATAEPVTSERNGGGGRSGFRARRAKRATRAKADETPENGDVTQVSSDAAAPAPPKRRRSRSDDTAQHSGEDTVVAPAPEPDPAPAPAAKREPVTYSTSPAHAEAEAVLVEEPEELDDPYPARSAMTVAAQPVYGERRVRQTISKVDLWSVTKLSLCFYISSMFVMIVALVSLWLIADAAGIISSVEDFLGDLFEASDFTFLSGDVLRGTILVGLVLVALEVVMTVIAASFYNIFAELFGGLEITVKEEEISR